MGDFNIIRGENFTGLAPVLTNIINWVLGFAALAAVLFIMYGGILYMSSGGNEERIKSAKKALTGAIIGLIVIILSYVIVWVIYNSINNLFPKPKPPKPERYQTGGIETIYKI